MVQGARESLTAQSIALPGRELAVGEGEFWQRLGPFEGAGPVGGEELPPEHPHRPAVEGDVMGDDHQQVLPCRDPHQPGPQRARGRQVEG